MAEPSAWKKALREPNAIGWIGFFLLVLAIGAATLWSGSGQPSDPKGASGPAVRALQ